MLKHDGGDLLLDNLPDGSDMTDRALMHRFVSEADSAAFEILVRRHGPMVLGVCRRVLRNGHDADDAFQTAFLVFFRKAHSIRTTAKVANWLYGVAYRSALRVKSARHTMGTREMQFEQMPDPAQATTSDDQCSELEELLDEELARLPEKYRLPIVLCDLEGSSIKEAARLLGCPEGTVSGSLSRGRTLLRNRLARHGLMLSVAALAGAISKQTFAAALPAPLLNSTIHGAGLLASGKAGLAEAYSAKVAAFTKGVMKSMFVQKLKIGGITLATLGVVTGGTVMSIGLPMRSATATGILLADATAARPAEIAQANVNADDPEFMAGIESLVKNGEMTLEQARHEIEEMRANVEKAAKDAGQQDLKPQEVQQHSEAERARIAAEKAAKAAMQSGSVFTPEQQAKADKIAAERAALAASGRDFGSGDYQPGNEAPKIEAEQAALEKAAAEQRAAAQKIASNDRK